MGEKLTAEQVKYLLNKGLIGPATADELYPTVAETQRWMDADQEVLDQHHAVSSLIAQTAMRLDYCQALLDSQAKEG